MQSADADAIFHALAHPARRDTVARLGLGPATMSDLARPYDVALPTFLQHLRVLERAGLVRSGKRGRVRTYEICPKRLAEAEGWLATQRKLWEARFDQLDALLITLEEPTP